MTALVLLAVATVPALWAFGAIWTARWPVGKMALFATGVALTHAAVTGSIFAVDGSPLDVAIGTAVCIIVAELLPLRVMNKARPGRDT